MFKKKECRNCRRKVNESYGYCPYCGSLLNKKHKRKEDLGLLGRDDIESFEEIPFPSGLNVLFNSLLKNLEKQFRDIDKENEKEKDNSNDRKTKKHGISISISTLGGRSPEIRVKSLGNKDFKLQEKKLLSNFSQENLKKISKLPREEPLANIRRLGDRVVYEINLPGVKSIKDISIIKLENSIEIKAVSKNKAYFKLIPLNLPIMDYNFSKGKLILELRERN